MDENNEKKEDKKVEEKVETVNENTTEETSSYQPVDTVETTYEPKPIETSDDSILSSKEENPNVKEVKETKKEKKKKEVDPNVPKKKGSAKTAIIIILAICLLVGIATAVYFLFFSVQTIDMSQYITVEYDGYDGYATATVELDKKIKDEFEDSSIYKSFKKKVELEITSDNYDLKNGDTLKVKVDISKSWLEKNRLELKDKTISIKISGIPEADTVDVFEDLEISVEGVSPYLSVTVNNNNPDEFIRTVYYSLSESYGLKNSDKITITANYSEYDAQEMGVIVAKDTMEYTIKDQPYYANSKDDISESIITTISADMLEEVKDNVDYGKSRIYYHYSDTYNPTAYYSDDLTAGEPTLVNLYLLSAKDSDSYYYADNYLYGVFKVTYTSKENGATFDWYFTTYTSDLAVTSDKKILEEEYDDYYYVNYSEGQSAESIYDEYIDDYKSDYIIETVK